FDDLMLLLCCRQGPVCFIPLNEWPCSRM
uniref:Conotoxin Cl1.2 n=1 Tax=Californiconus californicus TaxID=1736779 RepID=CU12_CONCL